MIDLSVVIPVYNEEASLPPLWSELREVLDRLGLTFEVVFVDDGSRDRSVELIRALTEEAKLAESIDGEVRKILGSYSRPMPEGSREWEVLYEKTREEVFRKRFRL